MKIGLLAARGTLMFLFGLSLAAEAADVKFFAGGGFRSVMTELAPAFERATGHKVLPTWDSAGGLQKRIIATGLSTAAAEPVAGKALIDFLRSDAATPV